MYDEAAVEAFKLVRRLVDALGPPILFRKMHGICNAIEMQVEDGVFRIEAVTVLGKALMETAVFYGISPDHHNKLAQEFGVFVEKLGPRGPA